MEIHGGSGGLWLRQWLGWRSLGFPPTRRAGKEMDSFADYIEHMSENGRWAGSLEAYGASKAYKVAVHIIPAPLRLANPGHFDWLCPVEGNTLPDGLCMGHAEGHVTDFPRGGGPKGAGRDDFSEKTVFTEAVAAKQESAESTVFTHVPKRRTQSSGEARATGSGEAGRAASESTCFTARPNDIRSYLFAARKAGTEALTGQRTTATSSLGSTTEEQAVEEEA